MKNKNLPSLLALTICLELIISPTLAMAQNANSVTNGIANGLNVGMNLYNTARGTQASSYVSADMAALKNQQTPQADKYFTTANMSKIPGLMEYIAKKNQDAASSGGKLINPNSLNCLTLPTTLYEAKNEVCRMGKISSTSGQDPKNQAAEAFAYYNQYEQIAKLYDNYSKKSNAEGQAFGTGCMENAMEILNGFFSYRTEQLDKMVTEFEKATARFEEQSEADLKSIRLSTAVLNGENSKFAGEFKNSEVFDYSKRFNNPACDSILSKDNMNNLGKESGLLGVEKKLKTDYSTVPAGSKYNPEQYIQNSANVVSDIEKMADNVSTQATLNPQQILDSNGYSAFLENVGNDVTSDSGVHQGLNKAFFSNLQTKFAQTTKPLRDEQALLESIAGNDTQAFKALKDANNDAAFKSALKILENRKKGECLKDTIQITDVALSQKANQVTTKKIKQDISSILNDFSLTPEQKVAQIKAIDSSRGGTFTMKLNSDYKYYKTVNGVKSATPTTVSASNSITPGEYFSHRLQNCEAQFQSNPMNESVSTLSTKEVIQRLNTLKADYQKAARQQAKDLKSEIVKKMVECNGNAAVASSTTVGSCSPARLDMTSPSFCAKAAFSCSKNMQSCTQQAQKFVKEIKDERLVKTTNYNANVELNRKQLVAMFDTTLNKYTKEAESLRGMFGAGFSSPQDLQRDIKDGSQFNADYQADSGDTLQIKDPKAYLEMIKKNMAGLRASVEKQQEAIVGRSGPLYAHIETTKKNYSSEVKGKAEDMAAKCHSAYAMYDASLAQQNDNLAKAKGEMGEKAAEFCGRYSDIMSPNPVPGCDDGFSSVSDALIKAAAKAGDSYTSAQAKEMRKKMQEVCAEPSNQRNKDGKQTLDAADVCVAARKNEPLQKSLASLGKDKDTWQKVCSYSSDESGKYCQKTTSTDSKGNESTVLNCSLFEKRIVAEYNGLFNGSSDDETVKSHATADTGTFCNAGNNSGLQNTKSNLFGDPNFLGGMTNPTTGNQ